MQMLSDDASGVSYLNVAAIDGDDDFTDLRGDAESAWAFDAYDIEFWDLDYVAFSQEDGGGYIYFLGGVDDRDLRDELDHWDYDDEEIRGVEVWIDSSSTWEAFAFLPGGAVLIASNEDDMEDMLRRRDRGGSSLDDEMGNAWRDLPPGYMRIVTSVGCAYSDCEFFGLSVEKENSLSVEKENSREAKAKFVLLFEFDSERDAERAEDDIEDNIRDDDDCDDSDVRQDGTRVRAEAVCDLDAIDLLSIYINILG